MVAESQTITSPDNRPHCVVGTNSRSAANVVVTNDDHGNMTRLIFTSILGNGNTVHEALVMFARNLDTNENRAQKTGRIGGSALNRCTASTPDRVIVLVPVISPLQLSVWPVEEGSWTIEQILLDLTKQAVFT